ncbi:alpha/beta hydrolase [Pseudomonas sp. N040]|uniref:alpha/beta hydrolase n=1 Tax=Pseudomonas sp. N040 TaxID=2785325 RepID=UPI0018A2AAEC|nr:alpha/beta fold hydrolase [Pseudomonas sp. N040]MBF7729521.1 alpha/beta fold hydrolase [Pseudomonas sp. N040]MBF7729841.1 alpha/beta fold hydrolase [Pseudomonas sp. N040]MBF7731664.1 alpha/beta fold hydrolase [Pseudomonas sp. N040]MBW7013161.1 alpha/beta fold hydrolase [Pseudomonas sp. N040]MBW7013483.1 alpha/beta fold hydrolase [Pseudomonas sp. N040]
MNTITDHVVPSTIQFVSGGSRCIADFYRPLGPGPFPVVVMAHGLGGTRKMRLPAFAERFVAAGYACLVFDYRHFGDSEGEPRQLLDIKRQLEDWKAAIAHVRRMDDVDPDRLALWGTSFGGGHVLTIAAEDAKVAAVISQCPFTDGLASILATEPLVSLRVSLLGLVDRIGSWFGARPILIPLAGRPGTTAFMTSPDSWDGYNSLIPPGESCRNEASARFALDLIRYYPGRRTPSIRAPVLFCVCDPDSVAPSKQTLRHAQRAPRHEIKRYPHGHFDIYVGTAFEQVVGDQLEFLRRNVPTIPAK